MGQVERKLYKVLRNVGVGKHIIIGAQNREELFLDDLDALLLVYYFESEFKVEVKEGDLEILNTIPQVGNFLTERKSA
ncbi:MAG: hypothetical protein Q8862_07390 [Bacteroidota bacterium]|nr:hypothetical protein [Bacteroidota bacterium]MDP4206804.1 hypothetical protein [Bacteroidota bacterium]